MNIPYGPILVVEDVPHILELLAVTLRFKGYPVVTAKNGEEALEMIAKEKPALVITDILMPRMDGFALMHSLRNNPKTGHIPVVFLSATYITPEDRDFALKLGAVRFLEKPVDTPEFLLTVAEILTQGPPAIPPPMSKDDFYRGYLDRLENKLHHKSQQITRTERLLETLPEEQKPAFESILKEARGHRTEIQEELSDLHKILSQVSDTK
ncbi:MAG: response regulator [Anaerolineales bacterium]|nr:response regulator [Chloroflexota bacterium]MBL6982092.1 response regulator [Anaerolineales bacterium]